MSASIHADLRMVPHESAVFSRGSDFSVVLFRSDFVLFPEQNHVKALTNQWVLTMPPHPERLAGATSRGPTMAPEGAEAFKVPMPDETLQGDVSTTYCEQSTFMGYHSQVRMPAR